MSGLPRGWAEDEAWKICELVQSGGTPKEGFIDKPGVPFLKVYNIVDQKIDFEYRPQFIDVDIHRSSMAKSQAYPGDVLMNIVGPPLGKVAVIPDCFPTWNVNQALTIFRPSEAVTSEWLYYFLCGGNSVKSVINETRGSAGQVNISLSQCRAFKLPLPPLAEQQRIVAKLDALNAKSARARTELARIETLVSHYKQAVLNKAFRGELTREWREISGVSFSASEKLAVGEALKRALSSRRGARTSTHQVNFDSVAAIPCSWAYATIGVAADMTVGFAFKSEWFRAEGVKLLRGVNIAPKAIHWSELKCLDPSRSKEFARYLVEENDIVLAMDRPVISTGLKVARIAKDDAGCLLVQRVTRFRASEFAAQDFLWWFLNTQMFLAHSLHRATGSDLPHISGDDIATCPLPLPPPKEQREIVRRIESAFVKIDRLAKEAKRALELVGRLDEAILAKAFRGELVPQDEKDDPAEHLLAHIRAEREKAAKAKRRPGDKV